MINILLIGLGGMGKVHYKNIAELDNARIVATVGKGDSDREFASSVGLPFYESVEDALKEHKEITVADITTPTFLHKDYAIKALNLGLDVIIEKPLALSEKDACDIFDSARMNSKNVYAAHVLRYTKEYSYLIDAVKDGRFGSVVDATFSRMSTRPAWSADSWLFDKEKSGLIPFDLHIHDLDIIVASFGTPEKTETSVHLKGGMHYRFKYDFSGFSVYAEAAWLDSPIPFSATYRVIFENAVLLYDGMSLTLYEKNKGRKDIDITYDKVISTGINVPPTGWYYSELKEILSLIENNRESNVKYSEILSVIKMLEVL